MAIPPRPGSGFIPAPIPSIPTLPPAGTPAPGAVAANFRSGPRTAENPYVRPQHFDWRSRMGAPNSLWAQLQALLSGAGFTGFGPPAGFAPPAGGGEMRYQPFPNPPAGVAPSVREQGPVPMPILPSANAFRSNEPIPMPVLGLPAMQEYPLLSRLASKRGIPTEPVPNFRLMA